MRWPPNDPFLAALAALVPAPSGPVDTIHGYLLDELKKMSREAGRTLDLGALAYETAERNPETTWRAIAEGIGTAPASVERKTRPDRIQHRLKRHAKLTGDPYPVHRSKNRAAEAYEELIANPGISHEDLAARVGFRTVTSLKVALHRYARLNGLPLGRGCRAPTPGDE